MKKMTTVLLMLAMIFSGIYMEMAEASDNIIIDGIDIRYAEGDYFTKDGESCATKSFRNGTCHDHDICVSSRDRRCNCLRYWPTGDPETCLVDLKSSQCFGFARYCQWIVYGSYDIEDPANYENLTGTLSARQCTAEKLKSKLMGCAPATHIRTGNNGHSLCVVSTTEEGITIAECNVDNICGIRTRTYTWKDFSRYLAKRNGIKYANAWCGEMKRPPFALEERVEEYEENRWVVFDDYCVSDVGWLR